jgi:HEPN domain-containing protein
MAESADLARELLGLAGDDEAAARAMLPIGSVTDAIVGFHAPQAVEKALKAVLASQGVESLTSITSAISPSCARRMQSSFPQHSRAWMI